MRNALVIRLFIAVAVVMFSAGCSMRGTAVSTGGNATSTYHEDATNPVVIKDGPGDVSNVGNKIGKDGEKEKK